MTSSNASASRSPGLVLALVGLLLATSCSSYQRDFRKAAAASPPEDPTGPWKGTWKSSANGHHGPLWCLITRDPETPDTYNFRYRAGWGVLQFGDYTHRIATRKKDGSLLLNHAMTLPKNFGTYRITGSVSPDRFEARYQGNGDQGTIRLRRPGQESR